MEDIKDIKKTLSENKDELAERFNVKSIGIFGSYAKGRQKKNSDIDILVELSKPLGIFGLMGLEDHLRKLTGTRRIDLVTKRTLKPLIKDEVLREAVYV